MKFNRLVNLTGHTLNFPNITIEPVGFARIHFKTWSTIIDGVKVSFDEIIDIFNLPQSEPGTLYIVSGTLRRALPRRYDLASPGVIERDGTNNVIKAHVLKLNHEKGILK